MADGERKKSKAKSAIRVNLTDLSNALSADTTSTVFDDVVRACGAKRLITASQSQEYTTNTAGKTLNSRAGSLTYNIMTTVEFVPEELDTFLCICMTVKI